jgi:hypothetical protein
LVCSGSKDAVVSFNQSWRLGNKTPSLTRESSL